MVLPVTHIFPKAVLKGLAGTALQEFVVALRPIILLPLTYWKDSQKTEATPLKYQVASNPNTPLATLTLLATNPNVNIRVSVTCNKKITGSLCKMLQEDTHYLVKYYLARNPKALKSTLIKLSKDSVLSVKEAVAKNPSTPAAVLGRLLTERSTRIRRGVINNPNTPTSILLCADSRKKIPKTLENSFRQRVKTTFHL